MRKALLHAGCCVFASLAQAQQPDIHNEFGTAAALSPASVSGAHAGSRLTQQEGPGPLTLQAAVDRALSANATLSAAAREVNALDGAVMQGDLRPNPELGLLVEDVRSRSRNTTLQISQTIERGDKRAARVSVAERGRALAGSDFLALRTALKADVAAAFFSVLLAQEGVLIAEASLDLAQRGSDVAARRVAAGKVSPVEQTRAKLAQAGASADLALARGELSAARSRLSTLWGNPQPRFERVVGDLDELPSLQPLPKLLERLAEAPALQRAQIEIERRQALAGVERSRAVQDVTLTAGIKRNEELGLDQVLFGVSIPLPVFDRNQGNVLEAVRRTEQSRDEFTALRVRLSSDMALAYERFGMSRALVQALRDDVLPGARSAFDAASKGFELGKFGFLDVLDAQRTLFQTRSGYLRALADMHRAAADIERLVGNPREQEQK
jgi:outer membrane protein, heavy metal efflux system